MIHIDKKTIEKLKNLNTDDLYVVADFDRTITDHNSCSSWGIFEVNNILGSDYSKRSKELYEFYYPLEIDLSIDFETKNDLMSSWWNKNLSMLIEFELKEELVNNSISNVSVMEFRSGGKEFLKLMFEKNVPVIIISAGIGNFIEQFLKINDCLYDNIRIVSNFLKFENGIAVGTTEDIIHSENKDRALFNESIKEIIGNRNNILLLGDNASDVKMAPIHKREDTIRIGFLDNKIEEKIDVFKEEFDIVCTDNTPFHELNEILVNL